MVGANHARVRRIRSVTGFAPEALRGLDADRAACGEIGRIPATIRGHGVEAHAVDAITDLGVVDTTDLDFVLLHARSVAQAGGSVKRASKKSIPVAKVFFSIR